MTVKEIVYLLSTKQGLTQDDLANKIGYTNQGSVARPGWSLWTLKSSLNLLTVMTDMFWTGRKSYEMGIWSS